MRNDQEEQRELKRKKAKLERLRYKLSGPTVHRTEKHCHRCNTTKPIGEFAVNKTAPDWHSSKCKACTVVAMAQWRKKNPERAKAHSSEQAARTRLQPDEKRLKYSRKYYLGHKEIQHERTRQWFAKNKKHRTKWMCNYIRERKLRDPMFAFSEKIRGKMRLLLRGYRKSASTEKLLGCTIADFKKYLELQWEPWMSWANYGSKVERGWVIDHIVPIEAFDLNKPEDQQCCFHHLNLRPLCSKANRDKWDKFDVAELEALRRKVLCLRELNSLHQKG